MRTSEDKERQVDARTAGSSESPFTSGFRMSIRDLLAFAAIIALALSFHRANVENAVLKAKIDAIPPQRPDLVLFGDHPIEDTYKVTSDIAMTGQLYPIELLVNKNATVIAKMLDPASGEVLCESSNSVDPRGGFGFTIKHNQNLSPGLYPILVEVKDKSNRLAYATSIIKLVR